MISSVQKLKNLIKMKSYTKKRGKVPIDIPALIHQFQHQKLLGKYFDDVFCSGYVETNCGSAPRYREGLGSVAWCSDAWVCDGTCLGLSQ